MTQEDRMALFEQIANLHGKLEHAAEKLFHAGDPLMLAIHDNAAIESGMFDQINSHLAGVEDVVASWRQTLERYRSLLVPQQEQQPGAGPSRSAPFSLSLKSNIKAQTDVV